MITVQYSTVQPHVHMALKTTMNSTYFLKAQTVTHVNTDKAPLFS